MRTSCSLLFILITLNSAPLLAKSSDGFPQPSVYEQAPFVLNKNANTNLPRTSPQVWEDLQQASIRKKIRRAVWHSAVLPGWGQLSNKRWWKVPIIYGAAISLGLVYRFNQHYYKEILTELQYRSIHKDQGKNPAYQLYSTDGLSSNKDYYRRNRDLAFLGLVAVYSANIIDAYVDAKLLQYDIDDKLSLHIVPSMEENMHLYHYASAPCISLVLNLNL